MSRSAPLGEVVIEASTTPAQPDDRSFLGKAVQRLGALPAGVLAGALFGVLFGGVLGRILMRVIFLIDKSNDGAETDFGTVGQITVGGTLQLLVLSSITGVMGGIFYIVIRRWLPWPSPVARGIFFGLLMMFGPGLLFLGDVDLQIFEPALLIFAAFVAFIVLYGVCVALLTERLHPPRAVRPGPHTEPAARWVVRLAAVGILVMAAMATYRVYDNAGTCLTADGEGGCGVHASDR